MRHSICKHHLKALLVSTALSLVTMGVGGAFNPSQAQSISQTELSNSTGLRQIRAPQAYARIRGPGGGEGVSIAIIDSGIDERHFDIAPNLERSFTIGGATNVAGSHGTAVAGIAAGAANRRGTMGVAYNAGIISYQGGDVSRNDPNSVNLDNDTIATAIRAAGGGFDVANTEADIINMSLGVSFSGPLRLSNGRIRAANENAATPVIERALRFTVGQGKLVVVATGNDFNDRRTLENSLGLGRGTIVDIGASYPAQFANRRDLSRGMIAVMAVDRNNQAASFSNSCLGVENRCLAAPGVSFQGAQARGGTGGIGSGTSYATPLVSGAAAVVQSAFRVTPQDAGNRLLRTATDLGRRGTDSLYGRGLLNLENALSPQGRLSLARTSSASGPSLALAGSTLSLGSSLSLSGAGADLLSKAVSLDDDNFPFPVDLGRSAKVQSRTTGLDAFIGSSRNRTAAVATDNGVYTLSMAEDLERDDPYRAQFASSDVSLKKDAPLPRMQMQAEVTDEVDLFFGLNGSSLTQGGLVRSLPQSGDFFQPTAFLAPFDQLSGELNGGGTSVSLGENTDLTISAFASADDEATRQAVMQKVELVHKTMGDAELRLGYGFMQEGGGFLGSEAKGAFGADSSGKSQYLDISLMMPLTEKVSLFGAYSQAGTDASGGDSLLSDYSTIRSDAFGAGLVMTDLAEKGDGLSLMVGQPLRVREGSAEVTVPVARNLDGTIVQEGAELDLAPDGREIAIETVYNFALDGDNQSLSAGGFVRLNPDHDPDAAPDVGLGLSYQLNF